MTSSGLSTVPTSSVQNSVSTYLQPYVGDMLSNTQALANAPMPTYTGQLTAGSSQLQNQAWGGLANLALPSSLTNAGTNLNNISNQEQNLSYTPTTFTNTYSAPSAYTPTNVTSNSFDANAAQQYMNPYIQNALNPQLSALQRQQQINQQGDLAKLTQAGAYGGSRQAVLEGQNNYNLLAQQANLIGTGYNQAYNQAGAQFNADQARNMQAQQANQLGSQYGYTQQMTQAQQEAQALQAQQKAQQDANQFGATYGLQGLQAATSAQQAAANAGTQEASYGLQNLQALNVVGGQQQALQQAADTAQYNQYLAQLQYPQTMLTLQKSIMAGLPQGTQTTYNATPSAFQNALSASGGVAAMTKNLQDAGLSAAAIASYFSRNYAAGNANGTSITGNGSTGDISSAMPYLNDGSPNPNYDAYADPNATQAQIDAQNQASLDAYNANPSPMYDSSGNVIG